MHKNLKEIKLLRKEGKTYQEIGNKFGLSKQRIYQIYNDGKLCQSLNFKRIELQCPICKIKCLFPPSVIRSGRKYCSSKCCGLATRKYKTKTERKEAMKIQYIEYHKRWYLKLKKDPKRYARHLKKQRKYQKNRKMNNGAKLIK